MRRAPWKFGIGALVVAGFLFLCTGAAFMAGASQGPRSAVITGTAGGGSVIIPPTRADGRVYVQERHMGFNPFGFVFGLIGFLFKLLILVLIVGFLARLFFWRGRGWGGPGQKGGPGGWNPQQRFEEWHRKQHEADAGAPAAAPAPAQPAAPQADAPTQPTAQSADAASAGDPPTEPKPA